MDLWHLLLFVAASLLALRSFVTLTSYHQRVALQRLIREGQEAPASPEAAASATKNVAA